MDLTEYTSLQSLPYAYPPSVDKATSPTTTNQSASEISLPLYRKIITHILLSTTLFLDTYNNTAFFAALPTVCSELKISDNESVWIFGAYQLTFAGMLLLCGRISDLYNPKWVFISGTMIMSVFSLSTGFVHAKIPFLTLRGLTGAGAALTIPSSQHLIVHIFTGAESQANALAAHSAFGAVGLVFGLLIGALFTEFSSWSWILYFEAILTGLISFFSLFFVPSLQRTKIQRTRIEQTLRLKRLDMIGVALITVGLLLFIFGTTSGLCYGWGSAQAIVSLVFSVGLIVGFFKWETYVPETNAALPPQIWKYENLTILTAMAFIPLLWWGSIYPLFSWFWQVVDDWSPIKVTLHFLPLVLGIFPVAPLTAILPSIIPPKWILLFGLVLLMIANALLPFNKAPTDYWRFGFPGFLIGTVGAATIFSTTNIVLLASTPSHISGVISALFMAAAQTGGATGLAIVTTIQTSVQNHKGGPSQFDGRAAGLWFLFTLCGVLAVLLVIFMTKTIIPKNREKAEAFELRQIFEEDTQQSRSSLLPSS